MSDSGARYAAVFVGGAFGALARWSVLLVFPPSPATFPWATFLANVSGAFGLGFAGVWLTERMKPHAWLRQLVAVGFFGAFTTFSIMALEGVLLIEEGFILLASTYWVATLLAGQSAGVAGMALGRLRRVPGGGR